MTDKSNDLNEQAICKTCGKKIPDSDRVGSITSYFFQPFLCNCAALGTELSSPADTGGKKPRPLKEKDPTGEFCVICGLQRDSSSPGGSITGFLFQATRCKCPPRDQILDDKMAERFWKLKQTDGGKTFGSDPVAKEDCEAPIQENVTYTRVNALNDAIIGNSYRIIKSVGSGGMGEVYLAKHLTLGKTCALKLIPPEQVTDSIWQRFQHEARTIAGLDHVNLVKVTDLGIHEGCLPYYAMEYVEGQNLMQMLLKQGPMPLKMVLEIFMQVCDGLDYAHRKGIIHRDLKPGNIMLARTNTGKDLVKILDFGLVKTIQKDRHQQSLTRVGEVFGTPLYMSPEQCMSSKVDNRSDIYSVGCTMFECLTGRPPFIPETAVEMMACHISSDPPTLASILGEAVIPQSMEVVLAKLLRKNPVERYQTLLELRRDLEKVEQGKTVEPFYLSRNRPRETATGIKSMEAANAPNYAAETAAATFLGVNRLVAAAILAVVLLGTAALFTAALHPAAHQNAPSPEFVEAIQSTPIAVEKSAKIAENATDNAPPASLKETAPYSTIVEKNRKKWRVFHFPTDIQIGCVRRSVGGSLEARGEVQFEAGEKVFFVPFPAVIKYPEYLKRFREGDIYQIKLESPANLASSDYPDSDTCLRTVACIPGVHALNLNSCDDLKNKSLASIEMYPALSELYLIDNSIDAPTLAKYSRLDQLKLIALEGYPDASPLVVALKNSANLKQLYLQHTHLPLSAIADIAKMPNLETLNFEEIVPNDREAAVKAIDLLSHCPKLERLIINHLPLSDKAIEALKLLKTLTVLSIEPKECGLTPLLKHVMIEALPGVKITDLNHNSFKIR